MITSSEQRRAAIACVGVMLVLAIAAGVHFIAPPRADDSLRPTLTSFMRLAPLELAPRLAPRSIQVNLVRSAGSTARRATRVFEPTVVNAPSAPSESEAALEIATGTPLGAGRALPEAMVFVAPEIAVPEPRSGKPASWPRPGIAARPAPRGAVTSAFVTAGNAVAGGFRTAGRALKRAF
jgi:hypothetical protein